MMKIFSLPIIVAIFALVVSCEKPQSDAEKSAQIEKEVQQRLAAEHQADDQQRLAQQQADLDAREKALAAKETSSVTEETTTVAPATPRVASRASSSNDESEPRSYDTFYRKLEPYGAWRETGDYGYVWQPREAQRSRDWRPYTDGRWAYTDAGWTWVSDEPFGWATYHYGRWTRLRDVGWVWVPGEEWAPAWVSWRKGDQNVGWAPLPPEARFDRNKGIHKWADNYYDIDAGEYVFIPNEEIGAENVQRAVIPAERNVTIVNETTNVTNITYSNTSVINEGPNYEELRSHSRRPLQRMRLQREYDVERNEAPRASVRGEVLQMMTPLFTARATERPRTSQPAIKQVTVERATAVNSPDAERARAKMRSENAPPSDAPPKKFEKPVVAEGTAAPVAAATATPAATTAAAAAATPAASAPATTTPAAEASATTPPRPRFTPRPTPAPTVAAAPTATATPRVVQAATALPSATAMPSATVAPSPTAAPVVAEPNASRGDRPDRDAMKAEQQRRREEAARKMMDANPRVRPSPSPAAATPAAATSPVAAAPSLPPRHTPTPRVPAITPLTTPVATAPASDVTPPIKKALATPAPTAPSRPADLEGTPSGIEMTNPPTGEAKRRRQVPPAAGSPSPTVSPAKGNAP